MILFIGDPTGCLPCRDNSAFMFRFYLDEACLHYIIWWLFEILMYVSFCALIAVN